VAELPVSMQVRSSQSQQQEEPAHPKPFRRFNTIAGVASWNLDDLHSLFILANRSKSLSKDC
jgi:hypothetical protein